MAEENLGTAVLRIVVDDDQARTALKLLKRDVESAGIFKSTTSLNSRQTKSERDLEVIKEKRFRLARRIEALEDKGVNVSRLRTQLGRLTTAYAERDFTLARNTARELARQATLAERTEKRRARAARSAKAEADESIRSARGLNRVNIDGSLRDVGSPRFVTRGARQGGQAESINALTAAQKRRYSLDQQIRSLEASGVRTDQLRVRLGEVTTAQANRQFGTFNRLADTLDFTLRKERDKLKVLQDQNREYERIGKLNVAPVRGGAAFPGSPAAIEAQQREGLRTGRLNAAPVRGGKAFPGSPAFLDSIFPSFPKEYFAKQAREVKAASQKQQGIISNAIIGGAFPLLFGQGIGASIGGAAGGAAGGAIGGQFGFGLSLVGTALGSQFDVALQKLGALAKALDDPIANFQTLVQNASLSSKELERYAQALIDSGRGAEAAAVIQRDLIGTFGSLQGAKEYNDAVDTISRAWSEASTVLASFVAGPLAALIRTLSQPTGGLATGVSFEQLVGQLSPDQFRQVQARREQVTEASRQARGGISAILPPSNEDVNKGLQAGIALAQQLLGIEKQRAELAARIAFAQVQNQKSLSTSYQLIDASTQGYERQSLELQKQQVLNERNRKLLELTDKERNDPANPKAVKIQQDAALELYRLTQQLNQLDKDRAAQKGLEAAQDNIKLQNIARQVTATQALSKAERGVARDTLATTQNIQAGIDAAKDREREIGAQIDAARQRGGDAGEQEAFRLVQEQKVAANQTRLELEKGAEALQRAGEQLRENLRGAVVNFTRVRSDPQGLNRFLNPQQQQQRAQADFQTLLPQFREAQGRFRELTGQRAPEFTGPTAGVNEAIRNFIDSVQTEREVTRNLLGVNQAIVTNTAQLNATNADLAAKIKELADKDWLVSVAVSGADAAVTGNAINSAFPIS